MADVNLRRRSWTLTIWRARLTVFLWAWTDGKGSRRGVGRAPGWGAYVGRTFFIPRGPKKPLRELLSGRPAGWCRTATSIEFMWRIPEDTYRERMGLIR